MASSLSDRVLPPIIFLTALLGTFVILVVVMNPTIESNKQMNNNAMLIPGIPDFEKTMFTGGGETFLAPDPYTVSSSDRVTNYPIQSTSKGIKFSTPAESNHPITMYVIGKHLADYGGDRHQLFFHQEGGWLGLTNYNEITDPQAFVGVAYSNGTAAYFVAHIHLRHVYDVFITNGPGSTNPANIQDDYFAYNYNVTIGYPTNATGTNAWTVIAGLFAFNLPGVPFYITVLIMAPIYVTIAMVGYIVVRSVLPI